jgi:hypothetical protein
MTLKPFFTPAALALAITMAAAPALAQSGEREQRRRSQNQTTRSDGGGQVRGSRDNESRRGVAVPRNATPRADNARVDDRQRNGWGSSGRSNNNRSYDNRAYGSRQNDSRAYDNRSYGGGRDNNWQSPRRDSAWRGSYDRNAWRSRIRLGLGLSIFAGRPFGFRFDYGWRPRFDYRYQMRPGAAYGGMSFLLNPDYAEVYIDGDFVGIARDFGGQPVPVAVGYHRIELYAQGFEPVAFDINVFPGQVIPYRGSLGPSY